MQKLLIFFLLLASCAARPEAFAPLAVDMPVPVLCKVPQIPAPPDFLASLPKKAGLADGMKACLQQALLEQSYAAQLNAALQACR